MSLTLDNNGSSTTTTRTTTTAQTGAPTPAAASGTGTSTPQGTDDKKKADEGVVQAARDMMHGIEQSIAKGLHSLFGSDNKIEPGELQAGIRNGCGRGGKCKPQRALNGSSGTYV